MKSYLVSLGVGILVGVIYGFLNVRSPAPPVVALVGLFGMLIGEQIVPVGKQMLAGHAFVVACDRSQVISHMFGRLPGRHASGETTSSAGKG